MNQSCPLPTKIEMLHNAYNRGLLTWEELWMCRDEVEKEGTGRITQREIIKSLAKKIGEKYAMFVNGFYLETVVKNKIDANSPKSEFREILAMAKKRRQEFEDSVREARLRYQFNKIFSKEVQ